MLRSLFCAITFMTRIPIPPINFSKEDWEKSSQFYPIVGGIIGILLILIGKVFHTIFPETILAFCIVVVWIWVTGGLHLDGWMDLADGLGSNRSREQMLEIMKDSRVGAMGVIAAILLIIGKMVFTYELVKHELFFFLLFSPIFARFMILLAIKYWSYRQNGLADGLGKYITQYTVIFHLIWILLVAYFVSGIAGILSIAGAALLNLLFIYNIYKKLTVLTGDCYGALIEWSELNLLFLFFIIERVI